MKVTLNIADFKIDVDSVIEAYRVLEANKGENKKANTTINTQTRSMFCYLCCKGTKDLKDRAEHAKKYICRLFPDSAASTVKTDSLSELDRAKRRAHSSVKKDMKRLYDACILHNIDPLDFRTTSTEAAGWIKSADNLIKAIREANGEVKKAKEEQAIKKANREAKRVHDMQLEIAELRAQLACYQTPESVTLIA